MFLRKIRKLIPRLYLLFPIPTGNPMLRNKDQEIKLINNIMQEVGFKD